MSNKESAKTLMSKIPVGISSCLLGEKVRYDGGHKNNPYIVSTLGYYFDFISFCPEMNIGLGVPRETIQLVDIAGTIRCVGTKTKSKDVTDKLIHCANQQHWHGSVCGYIFKKGSPSCGTENVKVINNGVAEHTGVGIYAKTLMLNFPDLPVIDEEQLGDMLLRDNFIQRVFIYRRWYDLLNYQLTWALLQKFHQQHELILFSHDMQQARNLKAGLSAALSESVEYYAPVYFSAFMKILKIEPSRNKHTVVLQHIHDFLKKHLNDDDNRELDELIDQYQSGHISLAVPITLFKHYFQKHQNEYIDNSYYLDFHFYKVI